jgi:hypothetical protein
MVDMTIRGKESRNDGKMITQFTPRNTSGECAPQDARKAGNQGRFRVCGAVERDVKELMRVVE